MKRVILCAVILLVIVLLCVASLVTVSRYQYVFAQEIHDLEQAIYQKTFEQLSAQAAQMSREWMDAEHVLIRFIRHTQLDEITSAMSRLEMLAKYGDLSQFSAELSRIKTLLHHIYDSELPFLRNIF
ncbi:MAG: DUF4363 family protein [Oscillospiraceae bacterium]|nr:DUF4363 family protein [Oscillospiraceae bacterium]